MADNIINQIKIGSNTYNVSDAVARTSLVRTLNFSTDNLSSEFSANSRYYRFMVNLSAISTSPVYASCIFATYKADIYRTSNLDLWTQVKIEGVYRNSGNTADDGYGLPQHITAIGKYGGVNGPANTWLACCDNLNLSKSKWTFYATAGLKYKIASERLDLFFFDYPNALTASTFVTTQSAWTNF